VSGGKGSKRIKVGKTVRYARLSTRSLKKGKRGKEAGGTDLRSLYNSLGTTEEPTLNRSRATGRGTVNRRTLKEWAKNISP